MELTGEQAKILRILRELDGQSINFDRLLLESGLSKTKVRLALVQLSDLRLIKIYDAD